MRLSEEEIKEQYVESIFDTLEQIEGVFKYNTKTYSLNELRGLNNILIEAHKLTIGNEEE